MTTQSHPYPTSLECDMAEVLPPGPLPVLEEQTVFGFPVPLVPNGKGTPFVPIRLFFARIATDPTIQIRDLAGQAFRRRPRLLPFLAPDGRGKMANCISFKTLCYFMTYCVHQRHVLPEFRAPLHDLETKVWKSFDEDKLSNEFFLWIEAFKARHGKGETA